MNAYVSDIEAIADSLDLTSFHLFGHSWGGLYAQIYAEQHPDRLLSLFLCSSGTGTGEVWKKCEREVLRSNKESCANGDWLRMGYYSVGGMLGSDKAYQKLFALVILLLLINDFMVLLLTKFPLSMYLFILIIFKTSNQVK